MDAKIFSNIRAALLIASMGSRLPSVAISKIKLYVTENELLREVSTKKLTFRTGIKTASTAKNP